MANNTLLVAGIGASAGGIQAARRFFQHVAADSGVAYVVILHLSPDHESHLSEVLQLSTSIPVTQVRERLLVKPDHIYVIPPNHILSMEDGHLAPSPITRIEDRRAPVDMFFRTLADTHGPLAVSVILSGSGADGSMGIKRVKEHGGLCLVQDPDEAEYAEMPRSSIATGLVDHVLPAAELPGALMAYKTTLEAIDLPDEKMLRSTPVELALREIFAQVRRQTGHDFSNYKRETVLRRIARRMGVHQISDLQVYAGYLEGRPQEARALLKDLLISVTNFFRDSDPFGVVERIVVPKLFEEKGEDDQVRIWVPGCATGEEAYSLAMLLAEHNVEPWAAPPVQLFASDIDDEAINFARAGLYSLNDAADVSPDRLQRFFVEEDDGYRIRRELRETILFAQHNALRDPPFAHLDLVSCRNLLIYLNRAAQRRLLEVLHFALSPGGYLFLGASESVESAGDLFIPVDREAHLFQSRPVPPRLPIPLGQPMTRRDDDGMHTPRPGVARPAGERLSYGDLHLRMLERYAAPSIVVNESYDVVHVSENAGQFLHQPGGELSHNILSLIRPELRLDLRAALYQASHQRAEVEARGLSVRIDDRTHVVNLSVRPALRDDDPARGFFLVMLDDAGGKPLHPAPSAVMSADETTRSLEHEAMQLREQLRATIERADTQAEELKASNEELQAINEELRSSTEELETSKEELQSVNEELRTVNQELKVKIDEQLRANDDIRNLINATDIGTIFLDRNSRVKLFTPKAQDIFRLIPADRGRPLSDISSRLTERDLQSDIEWVLARLERVAREIKTSDNHDYLMQIVPYRTGDEHISGVVLTFLDITHRREAKEALDAASIGFEARLDAGASELASAQQSLELEVNVRTKAEALVRGLLKRLITAQEDERRRIARDLHDHIGQLSTIIRLKLDTVRTLVPEPTEGPLQERLVEVEQMMAQLEQELDFLAWELRPAALDDLGLVAALDSFAREWSKNYNIPLQFHSAGIENQRLGFELETNLYRIAQEALNNVQKHADAKHVGVILERRGSELVLIVEDDGRGFSFDTASYPTSLNKQLGLAGMRERVSLIGGRLEVESAEGKGTTIFVRIPLPPPR